LQVEFKPIGRFKVDDQLYVVVSIRNYYRNRGVVIGQFVANADDEMLGFFKRSASLQLSPEKFKQLVEFLQQMAAKLDEEIERREA